MMLGFESSSEQEALDLVKVVLDAPIEIADYLRLRVLGFQNEEPDLLSYLDLLDNAHVDKRLHDPVDCRMR